MRIMQTIPSKLVPLLFLRDAWRLAPGTLIGATLGYLLQGIMPMAQVLVITWLTSALGHPMHSVITILPTVIGATFIIAFTATLTRIAARLGERLQNVMRCGYRCRLAETIARLSPAALARPQTLTQIRASHRAIYQLGYLPELNRTSKHSNYWFLHTVRHRICYNVSHV